MTDLIPAGAGRRAEQRRRRRQQRRRGVLAALGVLVVVLGVVTYRFAVDDTLPPPPASARERTQVTVLLQVRTAATTTALLAHDPSEEAGAVVLVPPQVLAVVPGRGSLPFGRVLAEVSPEASAAAFSDLAGVLVDGTWSLTPEALVALVDALGGITVDVDVPVVDGTQVVLAQGAQQVGGAAALRFSELLVPGEQEQARLARVQELLDGIVTALPATEDEVLALLAPLGAGSVVGGVDLEGLAELLVGLATDDEAAALQYDTLPVRSVDVGVGEPSLSLDDEATLALVDRLLPTSVPPGVREGGNRVLVLNGVGTPGLVEQVRARIVPEGFVFVGGRNAGAFGYPTTQVLVNEATPEAQQLGARVARALGVPETAVVADPGGTTVADVIVIVGADFVPS